MFRLDNCSAIVDSCNVEPEGPRFYRSTGSSPPTVDCSVELNCLSSGLQCSTVFRHCSTELAPLQRSAPNVVLGPLWEGSGQLRLLHYSSTVDYCLLERGSHKMLAPAAPTSLTLTVARSSKTNSKLQCREQCKTVPKEPEPMRPEPS